MTVLLSLRSDADKVFGGDVQYAEQIAKEFEREGIAVILSNQHPPKLSGIDLVNIINAVNLDEAAATARAAKQAGVKAILTPEYCTLDRFFLHTHWKANVARLVLGEKLAMQLFRLKKRQSKSWKKLSFLMRSVDRIVAKSEREKRQLILDFHLPKEGISVVPNGVDPRFGSGASPERFIRRYGVEDFLLTVGRVEPIKNQLSLLKATQGFAVPIVFIGGAYTASDSYLLECQQTAKGRRVYFIGHVPHDEIADAFAAARAHIAPGFNETTSLVSLEAALCGCPIVITRESPYMEYFGPRIITCDPYDINSIRSAVLKVLEHPKDVRVRARLVREMNWTEIARRLVGVYEKV